jgi:hypothetical protein
MIKEIILGQYHNSPPVSITYYKTEDFDRFCSDFSLTIDFLYNSLTTLPKPTIYFDEKCMEVFYSDINKRVKYEVVSDEEREEIGL